MYRLLIFLFVSAALLPVLAFGQTEFRSTASGVWNDNQNWQQTQSGIWQMAPHGVFPGEAHNRVVSVTIDDSSTIVIPEGKEVHIKSLNILKGRLIVNGILVVGDDENDGQDPNTAALDVSTTPSTPGLQLLQNSPNPVMMMQTNTTTFTFYLDAVYPLVRLTVYDEMGREVMHLFDQSNPAAGWTNLKVLTEDMQSGSYQVVLQAGNTMLHRTMTVIR
ncbi:MAG TPA: hypothetical protein VFO76_06645 [Candidatus Kapabacteria bacterium]|nr:hypothetical protein [Candidatus Kapabacteria bacterium]